MRAFAIVFSLLLTGCSNSESLKPTPKEVAAKMAANFETEQAEQQAFLDGLKKDPKQLFEEALSAAKSGFSQWVGDDSVAKSTITVDPQTLTTFGPKKWKVRGSFAGVDQRGKMLTTTWEVTLQVLSGCKISTDTQLSVKD